MFERIIVDVVIMTLHVRAIGVVNGLHPNNNIDSILVDFTFKHKMEEKRSWSNNVRLMLSSHKVPSPNL
jgi:hypothetical protein